MCRETKKAYMTVEASLLLPMIFVGIFFVISLGIYLYNAGTIQQAAYMASLRGSQMKSVDKDSVEMYTKQELEKILRNRMLAKDKMETKVKVSSNKVSVEIEYVMNVPFSHWISSKIKEWTVKGKAEAIRINPVDIIRNVRKMNGSQIQK